ncbi:RapZ C-terminal domain-containing protein [Streptosporangium saharense]|uniref:RapZ C-terminal domain-containing protein n=1 Tax=Streptosporangium saharense TaxID=1706840 RepID=UPI00331C088A
MGILIISYGWRHAPPPEADLHVDARRLLRNPHEDPSMRYLTGLDTAVACHVLDTPGARALVRHMAAAARDLAQILPHKQIVVGVGCQGGRHRAPALAQAILRDLRAHKVGEVEVTHRDIEKPLIQGKGRG